MGGLWASPVDCSWGWANWCRSEEWNEGALGEWFEFNYHGNVVVIDSHADLRALPQHNSKISHFFNSPDFERLLADGVDAIHLTERGEHETRFSEPSLYGWDCECVLIMNPEGIGPSESGKTNEDQEHSPLVRR